MSCGNCQGTESEMRRRVIQGGGQQFRHQCLTCGHATSNAVSKATVRNSSAVPEWDYDLSNRYDRNKGIQYIAEQEAARAGWFQEHNAYLKTEGWRLRRLAVLKRANGRCEGCGQSFATQVHHLSYEHWREEFLWELVAICDGCHERIHPHMQASSAGNSF